MGKVWTDEQISMLVSADDRLKASNSEFKVRDRVKIKCPVCGKVVEKTVRDILYHNIGGCRSCQGAKVIQKRFSFREYPEWFLNTLTEDFRVKAVSGELTTNDYAMFRCPIHGDYKAQVYTHIRLSDGKELCGCPKCHSYGFSSSYEGEICEYLESLGIFNIERNNRGYLSDRREIDIYLPDYRLGIEFNGSYYHASYNGFSDKPRLYHQSKFLDAKTRGIHLIQIYDVDWDRNKSKIKEYLRSLVVEPCKVYARKCDVRRISTEEAQSMYERYHLLGRVNKPKINYGLFYNDELISCMSFTDSKYHSKCQFELVRYVTKDLICVGGASKLYRAFIDEFDPSSVVSYSDNNYFQGKVYEVLGFDNEGQSTPRYYWYSHNDVRSREKCRLSILEREFPEAYRENICKSGDKERNIMSSLGYMQVYYSGITKWVWRK